jgi:3-isopropylmalate/(R)-2-methylmalate dehydratase small subunit
MKPFTKLTSVVAPLDRANVDTDAIIPKQFLRKIERTGFGKHLFHEWRYSDYEGRIENPAFILNHEPYSHAQILLARDNFGCGSSREHAPWALTDFGFRSIIAPSFADIFYSNCVKNGLLPVRLKSDQVEELFKYTAAKAGAELTVDLVDQVVITPRKRYGFELAAFSKECLLKGLDQIGWTLQFADEIDSYETILATKTPWLA